MVWAEFFSFCSNFHVVTSLIVQVAKENADVIIMDDNFATIVNVAKWGRAVYINIQKFVQFQLTVNVVALVLNFVSACISGVLSNEASFYQTRIIVLMVRHHNHYLTSA